MEGTSQHTRFQQADCLRAYQSTRSHSLSLIEHLTAEDCSLQAAPFVSPAKWHLAHTTWFFETFILMPHVSGYEPFHPDFQVLFNSYYNGIGEQFSRPKRHLLSRPALHQVLDYRAHIDQKMAQFIESQIGTDETSMQSLITLGIHHEQQHQELLLMDLKYCFFQNPLFPSYYPDSKTESLHESSPSIRPIEFISFAGGLSKLGVGADEAGFHFDNETPAHDVYLQDYQLANRLVSNGEFLQFMEEGGYDHADLWLSDGWAWLANVKKEAAVQQKSEQPPQTKMAPCYWIQKQGQWFEFTLNGLIPLDLYAPVKHVNFYEAMAYAQWSGCRLATEAEWERGVLEKPSQIMQVHDHVWQWTQSAYQPYPGFKKPDGAVGEYNGKFMCNQMVLRGGCEFTPDGHARISYRNFFYPEDQWVMAGIRLAKN
mgnify:CR=1 FL=1